MQPKTKISQVVFGKMYEQYEQSLHQDLEEAVEPTQPDEQNLMQPNGLGEHHQAAASASALCKDSALHDIKDKLAELQAALKHSGGHNELEVGVPKFDLSEQTSSWQPPENPQGKTGSNAQL